MEGVSIRHQELGAAPWYNVGIPFDSAAYHCQTDLQNRWKILVLELNRLWNFWLGLPVGPRTWEIRFPSRDEI